MHLKGIFAYTKNKKGSKKISNTFFQNKSVERMNEEIRCITKKGKAAKNEWEIDDSDFHRGLYSVYQKIRTIVFPSYLPVNLLKQRYISSVKSKYNIVHHRAGNSLPVFCHTCVENLLKGPVQARLFIF